jgi:hypothetical protein
MSTSVVSSFNLLTYSYFVSAICIFLTSISLTAYCLFPKKRGAKRLCLTLAALTILFLGFNFLLKRKFLGAVSDFNVSHPAHGVVN